MNALVLLALVASLAFGGAGATAYAAQGSLPDEPLYAVKLLTEDLRLDLARDPQAQLALVLELAQTRTQEMLRLVDDGQTVPAPVAARLRNHLETALQVTAGVGDAQLAGALALLQQQTQTQLQTVTQARRGAPEDAGLRLAEQHLTQTQALAQLGLDSPARFRSRVRAGQTTPAATPPPGLTQPGTGAGDGSCGDGSACTPELDGNRYGPGPQNPLVTPSGDANGAGPANPAATPAGAQNRYGPGPAPTHAPAASGTCTPEYDGNSYGPGPGNPAATPSGDQNSYGPGAPATAEAAPEQDGYGPGGPPATAPADGSDTGPGPRPAATPQPGGAGNGRP